MTCDWCSLPPNRCQCVTPSGEHSSEARSCGSSAPDGRLCPPQTEDHAHYFRVIGATFMRWQMAKELDREANV